MTSNVRHSPRQQLKSAMMREVGYIDSPRRVQIREEVLTIVNLVDRELRAQNIDYCILFGTLLGAIKVGGILPQDDDADLGVLLKDVPRVVALLKQVLKDTDYQLVPAAVGYIIHSRRNAAMVDLIPLDRDPIRPEYIVPCYPLDLARKPMFWPMGQKPWMEIRADHLHPLRDYVFDHLLLRGPNYPDQYLKKEYGVDYLAVSRRKGGYINVHALTPLFAKITQPFVRVITAFMRTNV